MDGYTYTILQHKDGTTSYEKEGNGKLGQKISEQEYFAAAAKRDALKKKPKPETVHLSVDAPTVGGEGGEGGGSH